MTARSIVSFDTRWRPRPFGLKAGRPNLLAHIVLARDRIVVGKRVDEKPVRRVVIRLELEASVSRAMTRPRCAYLAAANFTAQRARQRVQVRKAPILCAFYHLKSGGPPLAQRPASVSQNGIASFRSLAAAGRCWLNRNCRADVAAVPADDREVRRFDATILLVFVAARLQRHDRQQAIALLVAIHTAKSATAALPPLLPVTKVTTSPLSTPINGKNHCCTQGSRGCRRRLSPAN